MRFWSLKSCRSNLFQGRSFHPYIGSVCPAVLMACPLLLAPPPPKPSCPRRHIPRFGGGIRFLGNPSDAPLAADCLLAGVTTRRESMRVGYTVPDIRFAWP